MTGTRPRSLNPRPGDLAQVPRDVAARVVLHRRVGAGLVIARVHPDLVLLDDALVGLARHMPQPDQLAEIVVDAFARIAADEPDDFHLAGRRGPGDEAVDHP